jgi:co-chaperonin GroES (HSP10)
MTIRPLVTATAAIAAIVFGGVALTASAASARTIEGKISSVGENSRTVTIDKKSYRVSEGAKVLVSGKPGSFDDLKNGMTCKANLSYGVEAKSLVCTGRGR